MSAFGSVFTHLAQAGLPGIYFDIYTALLGLCFLGALFVYLRRRPLSRGVTPRRHLLRRVAESVMWISGIGLFFALMRYVSLTYVDMRFWSYLLVLLAIVYAGYLANYLSEHYPMQRYQFEQVEAGKRYRSQSRRSPQSASAQPAKPTIQKGKRRR